MPPKLPFDPRDRDEPESDRPPRRPAFVTRDEMNAAIAEAVRELQAPMRRIEAMATESRNELREAKKEREYRAQWEREKRESEQLEAMRERTKSENDLAQALQRPQTPMQFVPVVPKAPSSGSSLKPHSRTLRWLAVLVPVIVAIIGAIAAVVSNRTAPHGYVNPVPTEQHH